MKGLQHFRGGALQVLSCYSEDSRDRLAFRAPITILFTDSPLLGRDVIKSAIQSHTKRPSSQNCPTVGRLSS